MSDLPSAEFMVASRFAPTPPAVPAASTPEPAPARIAPTTAADLLSAPAADFSPDVTVPPGAREGLRGLLGSIGIRLAPGAAEQRRLDSASLLRRDEEVIRQATWPRAVSVLVANSKGGAGKTPVALLLGGTLAAVRGGSVCVLEVSDDPGALTFRSEGSPRLGLGQLVTQAAQVRSAGQLAGYTAPQTSFASVIGSVGSRPPLTREDVVAVSSLVDEFYAIRVMDSGNQLSSTAFAGAVETADALVIPVLNAGDSVLEALALLDRLRALGGSSAELASRAVILRMKDGRPEHPQVIERLNRILEGSGVARVFDVPYDAHIAERGQLSLNRLDRDTYRVFASAGAAIVRLLGDAV
jgi:MinD-like ATPase involved in chromosome partitioning or flagellar assembly